LVKANPKTVAYLDDMRDLKRQEYISFVQEKNEGDPDAEKPNEFDLKEKEQQNSAL
jgi:acyl-CoA-binding protein